VAFAMWAVYLFVRGVAVTTRAGRLRTVAAVAVALMLMLALFTPLILSSRLAA
jgi:hypothetical protein